MVIGICSKCIVGNSRKLIHVLKEYTLVILGFLMGNTNKGRKNKASNSSDVYLYYEDS